MEDLGAPTSYLTVPKGVPVYSIARWTNSSSPARSATSAAAKLPSPSANPGSLSVNPADLAGGRGRGLLRRAWDRLSGRG